MYGSSAECAAPFQSLRVTLDGEDRSAIISKEGKAVRAGLTQ
jgi:hypothetical protein